MKAMLIYIRRAREKLLKIFNGEVYGMKKRQQR